MLANGAKETTTTTGTGTVTLSAVTGFPRFSQVLSVGTFVDYAIQDGNNWEWGVGKLGASNTLERTLITAKFDGGTYSKNPATGLSLSGSAAVFCTLTAERAGAAGGGNTLSTWSSGLVSSAACVQTTLPATTVSLPGNLVIWVPFVWPSGARRSINNLRINITATGTATKVRIGILRPLGGTLSSLQLLAQTEDIDVSTTGTKVSSLAAPLAIPEPRFMFVLLANGTFTCRAADALVHDPYIPVHGGGLSYRVDIRNAQTDAGWTEITNAMLQRNWVSTEFESVRTPSIFIGQA